MAEWKALTKGNARLLPVVNEPVLIRTNTGEVMIGRFYGNASYEKRPIPIIFAKDKTKEKAYFATYDSRIKERAARAIKWHDLPQEETETPQEMPIAEIFNAVRINGNGNYTCYQLEDGSIYIDDIDITYPSLEEAQKEWIIF